MSVGRFCKDCKWCVPHRRVEVVGRLWWKRTRVHTDWLGAACQRVLSEYRHPVTGEDMTTRVMDTAARERRDLQYANTCGTEAKFFEPKQSGQPANPT